MDSEKRQNILPGSLTREKLPNHVAVIMDGNGRWAQGQGKPRVFGHRRGVETIREIVKAADQIGLKVLSLFAFSEENWGRPQYEVSVLMALINKYLVNERAELKRNNVQLRIMGRIERLPAKTRTLIKETQFYLKDCTGMVLNVALSYGGRTEIMDACQALAMQVRDGELNPEDINMASISGSMYNSDLPDPDLLIRTSGEKRISNFFLWQVAYSELYFTDKSWPAFNADDFTEALEVYQSRQRRFGLINEKSAEFTQNDNRC
jgi:undecaprenyl diphosphate synthase